MWKQMGLALCVMLLVGATARAQNPSKQEREIRAVAAHWQNDWNHHDFRALANLLSIDGDFVTDQGVWLHGREEFENWFAVDHRAMYQASHWSNNQLKIRFLQPDIAIVHLTWGVHGELNASGKPRPGRPGIATWLLIKVGDGWKIRTAQNTRQAE